MIYPVWQRENLPSYFLITICWFIGLFILLLLGKANSFLLIHEASSSPLDFFFKYLTHLGDGLFCLLVFILLLFRSYRYSIDFLIVFLLTGLLVQIGKRLLFPESLRPLAVLGTDILHFIPGVNLHERNSFPSGHAATGMACFLFLSVIQGRNVYKFFLLIVGLLVAYSRVYIGQHFLVDILAGIAMGVFSTLTWLNISNGINWGKWSRQGLSNRIKGRLT